MFRLPHLVGMILVATGLSGCALLDLWLGIPPDFNPDDPFPWPTAEASFNTGSATLDLGDETIVLDELLGGGMMIEDLGLSATWTNGEGWYLTYSGYPDLGFLSDSAYLSIDRIVDNQHWVIADPFRCVVTTERADATGVAGSAVCRGLEWSDYFGAFSALGFPLPIAGEPPFDADITFEAHSAGGSGPGVSLSIR